MSDKPSPVPKLADDKKALLLSLRAKTRQPESPRLTKDDLSGVNFKPMDIAMAYLCKYLGKDAMKVFMQAFHDPKEMRDVLGTSLQYLRAVDTYSYNLENMYKLSLHDVGAISSRTVSYQKTHTVITPFNWHDKMLNAGVVKILEDRGKEKIFNVGPTLHTVDYTSTDSAYKALKELFAQCSLMSKNEDFDVIPYDSFVLKLTLLLAYHSKIDITSEGLTLTFIKHHINLPGVPDDVAEDIAALVDHAQLTAKAVVAALDGKTKHYYTDSDRPLAVVYANLYSCKDLLEQFRPDIETLKTYQDVLGMNKVFCARKRSIEPILLENDKGGDKIYTAAKIFLESARKFRKLCDLLDAETHDEMVVERVFHLNEKKWGLLHRINVMYEVLHPLAPAMRPGKLIIIGPGSDKLALSMTLPLCKKFYGFGLEDFVTRYGGAGAKRYIEKVTGDNPKEDNFIIPAHDARELDKSTTSMIFVCELSTTEEDYDKKVMEYINRKPTILVLPHNLCKLGLFQSLVTMFENAGYWAKLHRHPRRHNDYYYWILQCSTPPKDWDKECAKVRAKIISEIDVNNRSRNVAMVAGWVMEHDSSNIVFLQSIGALIETIHMDKALAKKIDAHRIKEKGKLLGMLSAIEYNEDELDDDDPDNNNSDNNNNDNFSATGPRKAQKIIPIPGEEEMNEEGPADLTDKRTTTSPKQATLSELEAALEESRILAEEAAAGRSSTPLPVFNFSNFRVEKGYYVVERNGEPLLLDTVKACNFEPRPTTYEEFLLAKQAIIPPVGPVRWMEVSQSQTETSTQRNKQRPPPAKTPPPPRNTRSKKGE